MSELIGPSLKSGAGLCYKNGALLSANIPRYKAVAYSLNTRSYHDPCPQPIDASTPPRIHDATHAFCIILHHLSVPILKHANHTLLARFKIIRQDSNVQDVSEISCCDSLELHRIQQSS